MKYHELKVDSNKKPKRLGRGISAGQGKTAGRGTKGQKSRTGSKKRVGFSGGQNPLMQQLPKLPGFKSHKPKAQIVNLGQLEAIKAKIIDAELLASDKVISDAYAKIKLVASGELKSAKTVKLPAASQAAIDALNKSGGSFEKVARLKRAKKVSDSKS